MQVAKEILDEFGESAYHPPASSNMSKINPANEVTSVQHISSSDSAPYRFNSSLNQLRKRSCCIYNFNFDFESLKKIFFMHNFYI